MPGDDRPDLPESEDFSSAPGGSGVILAIIAIAVLLAIGFFYFTLERPKDTADDVLTQTVRPVDHAAANGVAPMRRDDGAGHRGKPGPAG